jgi:hypothetical protein
MFTQYALACRDEQRMKVGICGKPEHARGQIRGEAAAQCAMIVMG